MDTIYMYAQAEHKNNIKQNLQKMIIQQRIQSCYCENQKMCYMSRPSWDKFIHTDGMFSYANLISIKQYELELMKYTQALPFRT